MPILQWTEGAEILAPGNYAVQITKIEQVAGQYGPQLQFQFQLVDAEDKLTDGQIRGWCSERWGPKTKLTEWARNILGRLPGPDKPFDTDWLLGRKCDVLVAADPQTGGAPDRSKLAGVFPFRSISVTGGDGKDLPF